jgi:hypothetical protein
VFIGCDLVTLIDGSTTADGKTAELTFAIFIPCKEAGKLPQGMETFMAVVDANEPISFFAMNAKRVPRAATMEITTSNEFFWIASKGSKADCL